MNTPETNDDVVRAVACFALWNTTKGQERQSLVQIFQAYARRLPTFAMALAQVEELIVRLRAYHPPNHPQSQPIVIATENVLLISAMLEQTDYVRAVAFTTLWRYADTLARDELQTFLRTYCSTHPSFPTLLKRAVDDMTASTSRPKHKRAVARI